MAAVVTQKLAEDEYTPSPDTSCFTCYTWIRSLWIIYIEADVCIPAPNTI